MHPSPLPLRKILVSVFRTYLQPGRKEATLEELRDDATAIFSQKVSFLPFPVPSLLSYGRPREAPRLPPRENEVVAPQRSLSLRAIHHHRVQRENRAPLSASNRPSCHGPFMPDSSLALSCALAYRHGSSFVLWTTFVFFCFFFFFFLRYTCHELQESLRCRIFSFPDFSYPVQRRVHVSSFLDLHTCTLHIYIYRRTHTRVFIRFLPGHMFSLVCLIHLIHLFSRARTRILYRHECNFPIFL